MTKRLTREDQVIITTIASASSLKEGIEQAANKLESNFYSIKNRYYNHILPLLAHSDNPNYEFDDYFQSKEALFKDIDPIKASELIMNNELFSKWKDQSDMMSNTGIKIAFMYEKLVKENVELKIEVEMLKKLLNEK